MTKPASFDTMRKPMTERYIQTLLAYSALRSPRHIALTQLMSKPCLQATVFRSIRNLSYDDYEILTIGSYTIEVRFLTSSFGENNTNLAAFYNTVKDVCNYYCVTNGFLMPTALGNSRLKIYITSDCTDGGRTWPSTSGGAEIWIKESYVQNGTATRTIAHEFMHAIMFKYGILDAPLWFDEAFASMALLIYLVYNNPSSLTTGSNRIWFQEALEDYVFFSYYILHVMDDNMFEYGALVYPLNIYENHGGWATIKDIFENYGSASSCYDALQGTYRGNDFDYASIFIEMAINNLIPFLGYSEIAGLFYGMDFWPLPDVYEQGIPSTYTNQIAPMGNRYYKYCSTSNIGTLYVTADSSSDVTFSLGLGDNFSTPDSGVSRVTFSESNFGSDSKQSATIIVTNTNTGNRATAFTITSRVG